MQHLTDDQLQLYVRGRLPEDDAAVIEAHLKDCEECTNKIAEVADFLRRFRTLNTLPPDQIEKRQEPRITVNSTAIVHAINPLNLDRVTAHVLNASTSGLKMSCQAGYQVGTLLQIRLKDAFVLGQVRYCIQEVGDFHLGIRIEDLYPKSQVIGDTPH